MLQFIINRLMRSESADLNILDKLISVMSGVSQVENDAISDDQLQAYATGREMVREAFYSTIIAISKPADGDPGGKAKEAPFDKAKSTKKSLPRFVNALRDTKLATPMWIALAQTRQGAVDEMASAPIKAMASMQDTVSLPVPYKLSSIDQSQVHGVFFQYGDLLSEQLSSEEQIASTPDLSALVRDFGLDFAMAFQILRPRLNAELEKVKSDEKAAVHKRLAAEKQVLSLRINSPTKETSPALPSPKSPSLQLDGEDAQDVLMEDVKEVEANGVNGTSISSIPPPKLTSVSILAGHHSR